MGLAPLDPPYRTALELLWSIESNTTVICVMDHVEGMTPPSPDETTAAEAILPKDPRPLRCADRHYPVATPLAISDYPFGSKYPLVLHPDE